MMEYKSIRIRKILRFHQVRMAINLHIGMIFLKEKELYEKTMDEIYAKDIFNQGN